MLLISSNVYHRIVFVSLYVIVCLLYWITQATLEYSIIRRYTNIVYYYYINKDILCMTSFFKFNIFNISNSGPVWS